MFKSCFQSPSLSLSLSLSDGSSQLTQISVLFLLYSLPLRLEMFFRCREEERLKCVCRLTRLLTFVLLSFHKEEEGDFGHQNTLVSRICLCVKSLCVKNFFCVKRMTTHLPFSPLLL